MRKRWAACRFIRKNFAVTAFPVDSKMAQVLAWLVSRHLLISYSLYTSGAPLAACAARSVLPHAP